MITHDVAFYFHEAVIKKKKSCHSVCLHYSSMNSGSRSMLQCSNRSETIPQPKCFVLLVQDTGRSMNLMELFA